MAMITIEVEYDEKEVMDAVLYNIWSATSPWIVEYAYGSFDEDKIIPITYVDENNEFVKTTFTVDEIMAGLQHVLETGYVHCNADVSQDLNDWDACVSDLILQAAIFGDVIYG